MIERELLAEAASLFNRKLYFECHDLLEDRWAGERDPGDRAFLHGLIQIAVGLYHVSQRNHLGAVNLLSRGIEVLAPLAPERDGLDVRGFIDGARRCLEKSERGLAGEPVEWVAEDVPEMHLAEVD